ncbi:MAG: efflux RND transporter periplasmic adaptor subunit [Nitrospirae bacterium]|nr:efflux RND transporter periplasmic adaptor subunit [Nitrospirota bacterium]
MTTRLGRILALTSIHTLVLILTVSCGGRSDQEVVEGHEKEEGHNEAVEGLLEISAEKIAAMQLVTTAVEERTLPARLDTTGQVDFDQDQLAHVSARIPGRVHEVLAKLGARVEQGETLAVLDSIELGRAEADYLQAKAREQLTGENLRRAEGLYADRISSEQEMLSARAAHLEAESELQNAHETLHLYGMTRGQIDALTFDNQGRSLFPIRAPITGKIVEKHIARGELVPPERVLFSIANLEEVWIWIDVFERDLQQVHLEDDVEVRVDAFPDSTFHGWVTYLSDQIDLETRRVRARIDVENKDGRLRPGMFVRVSLSDPHSLGAGSSAAPVSTVPESAIQRVGDSSIVFVALSENRFQARPVRLGRRAGGVVEIVEGLSAEDEVVVEGGFFLKSEMSKDQLGEGDEH